jgi:hypothetical protein
MYASIRSARFFAGALALGYCGNPCPGGPHCEHRLSAGINDCSSVPAMYSEGGCPTMRTRAGTRTLSGQFRTPAGEPWTLEISFPERTDDFPCSSKELVVRLTPPPSLPIGDAVLGGANGPALGGVGACYVTVGERNRPAEDPGYSGAFELAFARSGTPVVCVRGGFDSPLYYE